MGSKTTAAAAAVAVAWLVAAPARAQLPDVVPPTATHDEGVAYPEQAVRDGVSGPTTVVLRLVVDAGGLVTDAEVETPQGHGFDEAALAAARTLRFAPATRDGVPIASRVRFRYVFTPPPPSTPPPASAPAPMPEPTSQPTSEPTPAADSTPPAPEEVVVQGRRADVQVARRSLTSDEMVHLPGARGDALASIEAMPGVGHAPPLSGLLILRGTGPNDTNVFVDGTGIDLPYHLGGLSAVVPSDVLERLDFYPGGYGAQYGRGMGGAVEFGIRAPRDDGRFHGLAQLDSIDARVLAEGPVAGGWRFLVAARRSTIDLWLDPILSGSGTPTFVPRYYDAQAELVKDLDSRRSFRLLVFGYDDQVDFFQGSNAPTPQFAGGAGEHIAFGAVQARYVDRYAPSGELRLMASIGRDIVSRAAGAFAYHIEQTPIDARADLSQRVSDGVRIETGIDLIHLPYSGSGRAPALADPDIPSGGPGVMPLQATVSGARFEPAAYLQGVLTPWWGSRIVPSLRVDYDGGTRASDYAPRITLRQDLPLSARRTTLKAAAGEYFQPPQLIEIVPAFGQTGLRSNRSIQYDAGIEQELTDQVDVSLDAFDTQMDRLVVPGSGNSGEGRAYGAEWLLRYKPDSRFYGWIAYTLSRSERRDAPSQPLYPFDFDETHNLSVVASWRIDDRWRVGARFRFVSGNPYTAEAPGALDAGSATYLPTPSLVPNGSRLPPFHQLDLRVDRTWRLGAARLTAYVDVENAYSYQAPIGLAYSFNYARSEFARGLPILPSLGLRGEL
jgi:TonB family protein